MTTKKLQKNTKNNGFHAKNIFMQEPKFSKKNAIFSHKREKNLR